VIRLPSLQRAVDCYYSGDPAFIQLADDASESDRAEHARKWKVARETGNYSALIVEGQQATKFAMQPVNRTVWRAFVDRVLYPTESPRRIGPITTPSLVFRLSVCSVSGLDVHVKRRAHREWDGWEMAEEEIVQVLDSIDPRIVTELGDLAFARMSDIPKNS
jgi:hypothetical protein